MLACAQLTQVLNLLLFTMAAKYQGRTRCHNGQKHNVNSNGKRDCNQDSRKDTRTNHLDGLDSLKRRTPVHRQNAPQACFQEIIPGPDEKPWLAASSWKMFPNTRMAVDFVYILRKIVLRFSADKTMTLIQTRGRFTADYSLLHSMRWLATLSHGRLYCTVCSTLHV